jgi:hypothetical protein
VSAASAAEPTPRSHTDQPMGRSAAIASRPRGEQFRDVSRRRHQPAPSSRLLYQRQPLPFGQIPAADDFTVSTPPEFRSHVGGTRRRSRPAQPPLSTEQRPASAFAGVWGRVCPASSGSNLRRERRHRLPYRTRIRICLATPRRRCTGSPGYFAACGHSQRICRIKDNGHRLSFCGPACSSFFGPEGVAFR